MLSVTQPWADWLVPDADVYDMLRRLRPGVPHRPRLASDNYTEDEYRAALMLMSRLRESVADNLPKTIENRTWTTRFRGQLFIHATSYARRDQEMIRQYRLPESDLVYGAVIGVVELIDVVDERLNPERGASLPMWGEAEQFHWHMRRPRRLATPVKCQGFRSLRRPTPEVYAAVVAQPEPVAP